MSTAPVRSMVVWCRDWSVAAMGAHPDEPAAVLFANRVVSCTPAARRHGVVVGHRRREAQTRCPDLGVFEQDERCEARRFEPIVRAIETFTPRVELTRPGSLLFATRGPARYFGGDEALAAQVAERVQATLASMGWHGAARVGVADGPFAATQAARGARSAFAEQVDHVGPAARADGRRHLLIVAPGSSPGFLAPLPIEVLQHPELADVLARLGLDTLGAFAAIDPADVVARFGAAGVFAHRLARGLDERPPDAAEPPPDLAVTAEIDPPADRIDRAAFVAKSLADELFAALAARGLSCTRLLVLTETEHAERIERLWRHETAFTPGAATDRVRWQLEGWWQGATKPTSGITLVRLTPDEVIPAHGRQLGFWGGETEVDSRAARALARVQGLLGPDAVCVPEWCGGRGPAEQLRLVPSGAVDLNGERPATKPEWITAPWPGRLPAPAPAMVHPDPLLVDVLDADHRRVAVSGRATLSAPPAWVGPDGGSGRGSDGESGGGSGRGPDGESGGESGGGSGRSPGGADLVAVVAWAGPWPADERWWDPVTHRHRARF